METYVLHAICNGHNGIKCGYLKSVKENPLLKDSWTEKIDDAEKLDLEDAKQYSKDIHQKLLNDGACDFGIFITPSNINEILPY